MQFQSELKLNLTLFSNINYVKVTFNGTARFMLKATD